MVFQDFLGHAYIDAFESKAGENEVENEQGHVAYCPPDTFVLCIRVPAQRFALLKIHP